MAVTGQSYEPDADLTALVDHPQNPRDGKTDVVAKSIDANGFYGAIIAHADTGYILAGHTRRRALVDTGTTHGPVIWLDCDDKTATRILLADNRTAELAAWDESALLSLLRGMGEAEFAGAGFTTFDLEALARSVDDFEPTITDERDDITSREITCPECGHTWEP